MTRGGRRRKFEDDDKIKRCRKSIAMEGSGSAAATTIICRRTAKTGDIDATKVEPRGRWRMELVVVCVFGVCVWCLVLISLDTWQQWHFTFLPAILLFSKKFLHSFHFATIFGGIAEVQYQYQYHFQLHSISVLRVDTPTYYYCIPRS